MKDYDSAIKFTKSLNDSLYCEKNELLGFSYGKTGDYALSIEHYENYMSDCNPSSIQRVNLGDSYFKNNQLKKAKDQFSQINEGDANFPLPNYNLGMIEYNQGDKVRAANYFTSAINARNSSSFDFDYLEMLIKTLKKLKEFDKAFKNIKTVLALWETNSLEYQYTLVLKASIFGANRKFKKALEILNYVLESEKDNQNVLLEAYVYQLEYYWKIRKNKKACIAYQNI
ncbi:hypothetical protein LCGC14_2465500 [marine sediment metagenome]|uniref:Uncharacterized protein n=1 Tax=marine sediment metagenome TaxID=412755 RepID=A0A0F9BCJ7_9ZZZZ